MLPTCARESGASISKAIDACAAMTTLDDLFEAFLDHLLDVPRIRKAEISLHNRQGDLVTVASAANPDCGKEGRRIRVQSWTLDSSIRHTTRRIRLPELFSGLSLPLPSQGECLGFLSVQWDRFPIPPMDELGDLRSAGLILAGRIKTIMLGEELRNVRSELQQMTAGNAENVQQLTALSKELYAITAISTKINQSMDFDRSLQKALLKIKEVFKTFRVVVYSRYPATSRLEPVSVETDAPETNRIMEKHERNLLREILASAKPVVKEFGFGPTEPPADPEHGGCPMATGVPLKSGETVIGALLGWFRTAGSFSQDNLRLLSGIANIMGMAIVNLSLFRQNEQKKKEAAFLVQSIAKFTEKLDLEKTLKSVAVKAAEFIGEECRVHLFSETKVPLVQATLKKDAKKNNLKAETFRNIPQDGLEACCRSLSGWDRPVLVRNVQRYRKITPAMKACLEKMGIRAMIVVPLHLGRNRTGVLLFSNWPGKRIFASHDLALARALGAAAAAAIENARTHTNSLEMSDFLEKKITEKTTEIRQILERQHVQVENRNDIIFRVNHRNRFVFVNRAMERLTGCTREELYSGSIKAEEVVLEEDRVRIRECFKSVLRGDLAMVKDLEYRHIYRNGDPHVISLTIYPETDSLGRIRGLEGVGRDVTEKKRLETELEKTKNLAMLGEFSGAVAHQLRNPLGNILMGTKLLQKALGLDAFPQKPPFRKTDPSGPIAANRETMGRIFTDLSDGIQNLNQVVTKLLEYTKSLKLSLSTQRIDIVLKESVGPFREMLAKNGIRIEEDFDPELPPLHVDALLIGQTFGNIIHNAIEAMPGGGMLSLACSFHPRRPDRALVSVTDSGVGIKRADLEKIFHPLFTTKPSGTGLGLSLAHRIVEAHGGMMWACQNPCPHRVDMIKDDKEQERLLPSRGVTVHIALPLDLRSDDRVFRRGSK
jgi:PAS domain S-box-containing protein